MILAEWLLTSATTRPPGTVVENCPALQLKHQSCPDLKEQDLPKAYSSSFSLTPSWLVFRRHLSWTPTLFHSWTNQTEPSSLKGELPFRHSSRVPVKSVYPTISDVVSN